MAFSDWTEIGIPKDVTPTVEPGAKGYTRRVWDGVLTMMVGSSKEAGWHLSISQCKENGKFRRLPNWQEIRDARYDFVQDEIYMAMILPPKREYVNLHPTTMQIFQMRRNE